MHLIILSEYLTLKYLVHPLNHVHQLRWFGRMILGILEGCDQVVLKSAGVDFHPAPSMYAKSHICD